MNTKAKSGNGQARNSDPKASKDRDQKSSLTTKKAELRQQMRNAPNGDKPTTRLEKTKSIWERMSEVERAKYQPEPWAKLHEDLARGPYTESIRDGETVRLEATAKGQHPELNRDSATLEQRIWSAENCKKLSPLGQQRLLEDRAALARRSKS
jgi:hypothetical protein